LAFFSLLSHPPTARAISLITTSCTIFGAAVKASGRLLPDGSGLDICGWTVRVTKAPISSDAELEQLKARARFPALPEQFFGGNALELHHRNSGAVLRFSAADALSEWHAAAHCSDRVTVHDAERWIKTRRAEAEAHGAKFLDYDWTFTTPYVGGLTSLEGNSAPSSTASASASASPPRQWQWDPTSRQSDRSLLTSRDPILLYADIPLFESELEDNGISQLSVKVRVMPRCWFVLLRFFLRVDRVMVRLRETRFFCRFDRPEERGLVLRELKHQEGRFAELRAAGAPPDGPAYSDGDAAATALQAVAPVGVQRYELASLDLSGRKAVDECL
jgi:type 2A phosphatase activator TIP41